MMQLEPQLIRKRTWAYYPTARFSACCALLKSVTAMTRLWRARVSSSRASRYSSTTPTWLAWRSLASLVISSAAATASSLILIWSFADCARAVSYTHLDVYKRQGYGLEASLTDAECFRIIEGMKPFFRAQDYTGGASFAVSAMIEATAGEYLGTGKTLAESHADPQVWVLVLFLAFILFSIGLYLYCLLYTSRCV